MRRSIFSALVLSGVIASAQDYKGRVGINTETPRASLEVKAVSLDGRTQGILFPYISETEKSRWTVDNAKGLIAGTVIWNTTKKCLDYFNGTTWQCTDGSKQNPHPTPWFDVTTLELTAGAFSGQYKEGVAFTSTNTVKFKLKNNGTEAITNLNLTNAVTVTNSTATITATGQNANAITIQAGQEIEITYILSGTPKEGTLTATFAYASKTATANTTVAMVLRIPTYPSTGMLNVSAGKHTIFSMYDIDYFPYTAPAMDAVASWEAEVADGTNESTIIDIQGIIPAAGRTVKIPIKYTGSNTTLAAFTSNAVAIDPNGEQGVTNSTRKLILSWEAQSLTSSTTYITAKITPADGQDLNVTKLDLNAGLDGNLVGPKLAEFSIPASNTNTTNTVPYTIRVTPGIPDRNFGQPDKKHDFIYLPIKAEDGKIWLNNNLGAEYADYNNPNGNFDPAQQAKAGKDHRAYGSLFQWQRKADGHELVSRSDDNRRGVFTPQTDVLADTWGDVGHDNFIYGSEYWTKLADTYNPPASLWGPNVGTETNDPCPDGFHVPTVDEVKYYNQIAYNWTQNPMSDLNRRKLNTPAVYERYYATGDPLTIDHKRYWTSNYAERGKALTVVIEPNFRGGASGTSNPMSMGYPIRCIAN